MRSRRPLSAARIVGESSTTRICIAAGHMDSPGGFPFLTHTFTNDRLDEDGGAILSGEFTGCGNRLRGWRRCLAHEQAQRPCGSKQ